MYWITKKLAKYVNEEVLKSHGTMHYHQSYSTMCSCISDMCNCSTHVLFGISCMSSSQELACSTHSMLLQISRFVVNLSLYIVHVGIANLQDGTKIKRRHVKQNKSKTWQSSWIV